MSLRLLGDRILIEFDPTEDQERTLESGIIIPTDVYDDIHQWGTVLDVGPGRWNKKQTLRIPVQVRPGDRVLYIRFLKNTHTGEAMRLSGQLTDRQFLIRESDVIAIAIQED